MYQEIMILNIVQTRNKTCIVKYCMKPKGNSGLMKGLVIMDELDVDDSIFNFPNKLIGKWIRVKIEVVHLKNNKIEQNIRKYLLNKYVV